MANAAKSYIDQMQDLINEQGALARKEGREGGIQFCLGLGKLTNEQIAQNFCQVEHARMKGELKLVSLDTLQI